MTKQVPGARSGNGGLLRRQIRPLNTAFTGIHSNKEPEARPHSQESSETGRFGLHSQEPHKFGLHSQKPQPEASQPQASQTGDRKSTRLNSSHR